MKSHMYNVSPYQKSLWKMHHRFNDDARATVREGGERFSVFDTFSDEVFHRMYSETPVRSDEKCDELLSKLHSQMDQLPEVADLANRTAGDEHWSGIATTAVLQSLLETLPQSDEMFMDSVGEEHALEMLKQIIENSNGEERTEYQALLDDMMDEKNPNSVAANQKNVSDYLKKIDESAVRNAVRKAVSVANERISEDEAMISGLSYGDGEGCNGRASAYTRNVLRKYLASNKKIGDIAKIAGRLKRLAMENQRQKPRNGTDEIMGVEFGNDLSRMIPSELLYADDEVQFMFAKKMYEHSLMEFELNKLPQKESGPIVMLVDSSGSMRGFREQWAGAVCLAFAEIANKQKRSFAVIHFGGKVLRTEKFKKGESDFEKLMTTVSFFAADGGTNFQAPLSAGLDVIKEDECFENADIIMITDGCCAVTHEFLSVFNVEKKSIGVHVYSIAIGTNDVSTLNQFSDMVVGLDSAIKDDSAVQSIFKSV